MNENLFEKALRNNESSRFFKGEPPYFLRNPETGEHSFYVHMSGWVANYINQGQEKALKFQEAFRAFIETSDSSSETDFDCVMGNVFAYVSLRERGLVVDPLTFNNGDDKVFSALKRFVDNVKRSSVLKERESEINNFCEYFRDHNEALLASLFCH